MWGYPGKLRLQHESAANFKILSYHSGMGMGGGCGGGSCGGGMGGWGGMGGCY